MSISNSWIQAISITAIFSICVSIFTLGASTPRNTLQDATKTAFITTVARSPSLPFIANTGQLDTRIAYLSSSLNGTVIITKQGTIIYAVPTPAQHQHLLHKRNHNYSVLTLQLKPLSQSKLSPKALEATATQVNFFVGNDKSRWRAHIPTYTGVSFGHPWPGILLQYRNHYSDTEEIYTIAPGANVNDIRVKVSGVTSLRLVHDQLVAKKSTGRVIFSTPFAWQVINGTRHLVDARYALNGDEYGFRLGKYDPHYAVVIDPDVQSTYVPAGTTNIALDSSGDVYAAGPIYAPTTDVDTSTGAQPLFAGAPDILLVKFNPQLTSVENATYLGGSQADLPNGLSVDSNGNVFITGTTTSTDFPGTTGGAIPVNTDPSWAIFAAKLNGDLSVLQQSTYLCGGGQDIAISMALDSAGDVYVTGNTNSTNFPDTAGGAESSNSNASGYLIGFIGKFSSTLTTLDQVTYVGGVSGTNGGVLPEAIAIGPLGDVYLTGTTNATNMPYTSGGAQSGNLNSAGYSTGFVSKLNSALTSIEQSTYLGGSGSGTLDPADLPTSIVSNSSGDVYVAGFTTSLDFPATAGGAVFTNTWSGAYTGFIVEMNAALSTFVQSTYLGGGQEYVAGGIPNSEGAEWVALDPSGNLYVAGNTKGNDIQGATPPSFQYANAGPINAFISLVSSDLKVVNRSTYFGGTTGTYASGIALGPNEIVYLGGNGGNGSIPDVSGGAITNPNPGFVSALAPDLLGPLPIRLFLSSSQNVVPLGNNYSYNLSVYNASQTPYSDATNVVVTDTISNSLIFVSATPSQGSCSQNGITISCFLGSIPDGSEPTIAIVVTAPDTGSVVPNSATISLDQGIDPNYIGFDNPNINTTVDNAATANDGSISTTMNQTISGTLSTTLAYSGQTTQYQIVGTPAHGSVNLTNTSAGSFTYTPATGYTGSDIFTFNVTDVLGILSNTATETVTITQVVMAPTANNGSVTTTEGTAVSGTLSASGSGTLTYTAVTQPSHGTLTVTASTGAFTYTPASGFSGSDSFTFTVTNSGGTSSPATEGISVTVSSGGGGSGGSGSSSGGGGGAFGILSLILLAGFVSRRKRR